MQDLINHCLQYVPVQRPSMKSVFERLCTSEFLALKKSFPVERNLRVETFTARVSMVLDPVIYSKILLLLHIDSAVERIFGYYRMFIC